MGNFIPVEPEKWAEMVKAAAEVERLKADVGELCEAIKLASEVGIKMADEVTRLKTEVERLRKAGDEMLENYKTHRVIFPSAVYAWNAAKEGKQS